MCEIRSISASFHAAKKHHPDVTGGDGSSFKEPSCKLITQLEDSRIDPLLAACYAGDKRFVSCAVVCEVSYPPPLETTSAVHSLTHNCPSRRADYDRTRGTAAAAGMGSSRPNTQRGSVSYTPNV